MNQITNIKSTNVVTVSMGYDNIESNIILSRGEGTKLPDPSINMPYDIMWWNGSDYVTPLDDPHLEIVRCIAKFGDTLIVMRSQQQTLASSKNIPNKLYNMMYLPGDNVETLSYYNVPQPHGSASHTGIIGDHTTNLSNIGSNTHAQIDTAIGTTLPGLVTAHANLTGTSVHGLGTMSTQASNTVSITGGSVTGITDLAIADGGTGASTAASARLNLGSNDANGRLPKAQLPTQIVNAYWHASADEMTATLGTWSSTSNGSQTDYDDALLPWPGYYYNNTTHNNNDEINFGTIALNDGVYKISWGGVTTSANGIMEVLIGSTSLGTIDLYSASTVYNTYLTTTANITLIRPSGLLRVKCTGKNGSSGGYYIYISRLEIFRTG